MIENKKPRRLKNVTVDEVSLVDNPANNRSFLLFKRQNDVETDDDGIEEIQTNYAFGCLPTGEKLEFLKRMKKVAETVDAMMEIRKLREGLNRLYKRNAGLFTEFTRATQEELKNDWIYELDPDGIPIISKRVPQKNPFETPSHNFDRETGRWVPKPRRQALCG